MSKREIWLADWVFEIKGGGKYVRKNIVTIKLPFDQAMKGLSYSRAIKDLRSATLQKLSNYKSPDKKHLKKVLEIKYTKFINYAN